jgi:hypothetical protein
VLAYHPYAPPPASSLAAPPQLWRAFPVVDAERWSGWMWLTGWNDTFFMALLFFLSGLFVWPGLRQHGAGGYLRRRALRLGVPFVVAAGLLAPLAYLPAYLQGGAPFDLVAYARAWLATGSWASGPAWFLWVLLVLDVAAAALFALKPRRLPGACLLGLPVPTFAVLVLLGVLYVPLALEVGAMHWTVLGPFQVQTSRVLHYPLYFFAGVAVGAVGLERSFLAAGGALARRWGAWLGLAGLAFAASTLAALHAFGNPTWWPVAAAGFVVTCAASCFALLAIFVRFADRPSWFTATVAPNAYGMYLVHYAVVTWLQLAFLALPLSGFEKGALVTGLAILLSCVAVAGARFWVAPRRPIFG